MKKILNILFLSFFIVSCQKKEEKIEFHPFVLKAKETSLYTNNVDWKTVNNKFIKLTKGKETVAELKEGLQFLINSLGDKHAAIRSTKNYAIVVGYKGAVAPDNRKPSFVNSVINDLSIPFSYQLLANNTGYLKIVGVGPGDVKQQADKIRNGLKKLKLEKVNKWIVDLRYNGGGNIEPMIAGLAPLIGEGFVGGAINGNDSIRPFEIKNSQFYNYNRLTCKMDSLPKIETSEKVAVLLSRYTISSGELLAVAFKERKNTKFIGEPTAGYTTGNGYDVLSDSLAMVISQDIFIDRNLKKYDKKVPVDTFVEFEHYKEFNSEDSQIKKAVLWLNKQ